MLNFTISHSLFNQINENFSIVLRYNTIFKHGTPTKFSAAVLFMFHKIKNVDFYDINLPTSLETFIERRVISLSGSALFKTINTLNEEN